MDLVAWWTKASVNSIDAANLGAWVHSKRPGFEEVMGSMTVTYSDGSKLELSCNANNEPIRISVITPQGNWVIEESAGKVKGPIGQQLHGRLCLQSELTAPLVKRVMQEGQCGLPSLTESLNQHRPLLTVLQNHWNQSHDCHDSIVPIT